MTLKRTQVMLLPTKEKAENCFLINDFNNLNYFKTFFTKSYLSYIERKAFHLYFLSDDKIKADEWVYQTVTKSVIQAPFDCDNDHRYKKIIATTDSSLITEKGLDSFSAKPDLLPQPSEDFINVFVTEYNKGNIIKEVDVEYSNCIVGMCQVNKMTCGHSGCEKPKLKVNPKNEISIKKIKDVWTRDEVIKILGDLTEAVSRNHRFGDGNFSLLKFIEDTL